MSNTELIPSLFGITLIAVAIVAIVVFARFMSKRRNRHPMDSPRGEDIQRQRDAETRDARRDGAIDPPPSI